jgi:acyl carrier protein
VALGAAPPRHVVAARFAPAALTGTALGRVEAEPAAPETDLLGEWQRTVPALRRTVVSAFVLDHARTVLGVPASTTIDPHQPFQELGLDSLMAIELRNAVGAAVGRSQPATLLFDHPTPASLVDHLLTLLDAGQPAADAGVPTDGGDLNDRDVDGDLGDDLAGLSEEEAEVLLLRELGELER